MKQLTMKILVSTVFVLSFVGTAQGGVVGRSCWAWDPCPSGYSCHPWIQKCYHSPRIVGEPCVAGYGCAAGLTCEAGSQICRAPGKTGDPCHATRPCGAGYSCQPGVQRCYHSPRQFDEPCVAGYECGSGLNCQPGVHKCYHVPRKKDEPCSAGYGCGPGLTCEAGSQVCRDGGTKEDPCHATRPCGPGYHCSAGSHTCEPNQVKFVQPSKNTCKDRPLPKDGKLRILTYNAFLIAVSEFAGSNPERAKLIPEWVRKQDYDIVVFSETWMHPGTVKDTMMSQSDFCDYRYDDREMKGSGLAIYSKYPIEKFEFHNFGSLCKGDDCLADKGFIYAIINLGGAQKRKVNIIGTHTNAGADNFAERNLQYSVIEKRIDKAVKDGEVNVDDFGVLIAGDLNEDKENQSSDHYKKMLDALGSADLHLDNKNGIYTWDSSSNSMADDGKKEKLDYVLQRFKESGEAGSDAAAKDSRVKDSMCVIYKPKGSYHYAKGNADPVVAEGDLSDHYPIGCTVVGKTQ